MRVRHMATKSRKEMIQQLLADDPNNAEMRYLLGMEHVTEGDDAAAVSCFEAAIMADPTYAHAYHQAARLAARWYTSQ